MANSTHSEVFATLWPGGPYAVEIVPPAARPDSLAGKTIGFLWDDMFRGEEIFPVIEAEIRARHPNTRFVGWEAFGSIFGGDEHRVLAELPARLAAEGVDAVVCGVGC